MGRGLLFASLSGAGKGIASAAEQNQRANDERSLIEQRANAERSLMAERAKLEEEKQLRIDQVLRDRTRAAAAEQGQEIEAGASALQDRRIAEKTQAPDGPSLTAEDVRAKRAQPGGSPISGLLNSTRRSESEDRAAVASKLGYTDAAKEYRNEAKDEARDARDNKRIDAQIAQQEKQLNAQVAHWKAMERKSGGDPATSALAKMKLEEFKMQREWQDALSKTAVGSPERAALMQKGRDYEWIKDAPNDVTVSTKSTDAEGNEITTTRKGSSQTVQPQSKPFNPDDFRTKPDRPATNSKPAGPAAESAKPAPTSPKEMAIEALDRAIETTARQLTQASNSGNASEVARLNAQLQEQQRAKSKAME